MVKEGDVVAELVPESVWIKYSNTKDVGLRNEIVMKYIGVVKAIVLRMRGACGNAEIDDLIDHGVITLMECVDRFDYERDIKFETFASIRIRGAIIDYVRRQDWVPRSLRKSAKMVEEAYMVEEASEGDGSVEERVSKRLKITVAEVRRLMGEVSRFNIVSYEELVYNSIKGEKSNVELADGSGTGDPENELLRRELMEELAKVLETLSEKEQLVLSLYYSKLLRFREIAEVLCVSESRVSQLHSRAIKKIKDRFSAREKKD